jgi:hypothetical protein
VDQPAARAELHERGDRARPAGDHHDGRSEAKGRKLSEQGLSSIPPQRRRPGVSISEARFLGFLSFAVVGVLASAGPPLIVAPRDAETYLQLAHTLEGFLVVLC